VPAWHAPEFVSEFHWFIAFTLSAASISPAWPEVQSHKCVKVEIYEMRLKAEVERVSKSMQRPGQHHRKHQHHPLHEISSKTQWWPPGWVEERRTPCRQWFLHRRRRSARGEAGPGYDFQLCCFEFNLVKSIWSNSEKMKAGSNYDIQHEFGVKSEGLW